MKPECGSAEGSGGTASGVAPRGNRADLVREARPQLARQVVPHSLEPDELCAADVLREREATADVDQRVVEAVHDQGRDLDVAEVLRPVRLRHRRSKLAHVATTVE